jgi:hypothetical protein
MNNIFYYEQMSRFKNSINLDDLTDEDYMKNSKLFIEFVDKLLLKKQKTWIYLSIGGCYSNKENKNFCINNQLLPTFNYLDDYEPIYIGIDNFNYMEKEEFEKYNKVDHIYLFNMYWIDTYKPLVDCLYKLFEYNIKSKGIIICTNFCKYKMFRSPIFPNLISLFYNDYDLNEFKNIYSRIFFSGIKIDKHTEYIKKNRCIFLEWEGLISENNKKLYLVGYNNEFTRINFKGTPTLIQNITDLSGTPSAYEFTNQIYFNIDQLLFDIDS